MISFKGILKYSIYIFIAGWMFLLGIMVGRGSSPVKFDTQKFQKRLETIASEFGEKKETQGKIELKFYDVLDNPVPEEGTPSKNKPLEIIPKKQVIVTTDEIPLKTSRKKQTFKQERNKVKADGKIVEISKIKDLKPAEIRTKSAGLKKNKTNQSLEKKIVKGKYTIQIAAYKEFKDAVTHMAILEKKGFSSYRVKGEKDGVTWYRIRTGSFASYDEAKKFKDKLNKAKINSMIINKE
ncbi:MAG: SPOR domain-containing protein [Desulfobacula sp.]|nr:SPOR domain-containing protein [Desulfobacula sp.]